MAASLQDNLVSLLQCARAEDPVLTAVKAQDLVADIAHACLHDVGQKEIDYVLSLLFEKDNGLVAFLRKTVGQDEFTNAKVEGLQLLGSLVRVHEGRVLPYAVDIKEMTLSLFTRDKYAKVKSETIPLLIELLKHAQGSKMAKDLGVANMAEKFFMELIKTSKHSSTVKQHIYHLLGMLAEVYPEEMVKYADRMADLYVKTLKSEMTSKTKKPELPIIAGCLQGLTCYLFNFNQSAEEGSKHSYDIFKYCRMAIDHKISHTRFEMPKSGLILLTKHAAQFNQYLVEDYEGMFERLYSWSKHHNRDMTHHGTLALEAFLRQISEMLVDRAKQGKKEGATFKFFIQKFRSVMDNPDAKSKEIALSIRGYGYFAAPCKLFLSTEDVKFMFNEMIQRSEQIFFSQPELSDERLLNLPSFLEALGSIVRELDAVSDAFLSSLEKLVILQMENAPKLHKKLQFLSHLALLRVLLALIPKGAAFRSFLSRVVYQGLIRTCSHPVHLDADDMAPEQISEEAEAQFRKQDISYRDYLSLWSALLSSATFKDLGHEGIGLEERHRLTAAIYDELVSSMMRILERLDLTSSRASDIDEADQEPGTSAEDRTMSAEDATSDPVKGLQAARPKDFIVFINLVDFARDLLQQKHVGHFERWVFPFGHQVILQSTTHPLVSGFYKLLAANMKICTKIGYFKRLSGSGNNNLDVKVKVEDSEDVEMEDQQDSTQREAAFLLFSKFTKEVLSRMKQYKDDLLASCLTLILSLPLEIVSVELVAIVSALELTFRIGQSYMVLAEAGLSALELWSRALPPHLIQPHYPTILPCLDAYLSSTLDTAGEGVEKTMALTSKQGQRKGKRKIPVKLLQMTKEDIAKNQAPQLAQVKLRCVRLLGSLGGSVNNSLVTSGSDMMTKLAIAWDNQNHLKFDVPFMDIKPTIYFDSFLPRIVELATTSTERQTKVAACELLHSMVLYMLGRGAQHPGGASSQPRQPMSALYRKIFPTVLQLACDVEQVSKQLFEPLMMQLIHWFTNNKTFESEETMALLDTLMDGVVCPTDTALRDFSARCVREFLHWSIKQTSKKQMERSSLNVKSLLKRLYSLANHPSSFKRLGAALAFNNIYAVFREEESLVDVFTFEILVNYVESLALAHSDDKSLGTQEQCHRVLTHLERIIRTKATLLSKETKNRVKPRSPGDANTWSEATLVVALRWLLRQCGRPQTECRHACMELVFKLSTCVQGVKVPQDFFKAFLKDFGPAYYLQRFEKGTYKTHARSGLVRCPTMAELHDSFTVKTAVVWFDTFLATLDCYTWLFGEELLSPSQVLIAKGNKGTIVFQVINHFMEHLALGDIHSAAKLFKSTQDTAIFTPREAEEYNRAKCTVLVRVLMFICIMLRKHQNDSLKVIPGSVWSQKLWDAVVSCVLEPSSVGFNMGDVEILMKLPQETSTMLYVISRCLPVNISKGFKARLSAHLVHKGPKYLAGMLPLSLHDSSVDDVRLGHLVAGYEQLHGTGLLTTCLQHSASTEAFAEQLFQTVFKAASTQQDDHQVAARLSPTSMNLAKRLLDLAFLLGLKPCKVLQLILDKTSLTTVGLNTAHQGEVFYAMFRNCISRHLVAMARDFVPELFKYAQKEWGIVGSVFTGILEAISRDRTLRKKEGSRVAELVSRSWPLLRCWWAESGTQETKTQALAALGKLVLLDSKVVSDVKHSGFQPLFDMYLHMLTDSSLPLPFKSRVMDLLPFFATLPEKHLIDLKSKLDRMVADNFPMKSSEFSPGSPKFNDYITALNKILYALELSGSLMLLELLISVMCREARHVHEDAIQNALIRFTKRLPLDKHKLALDVPYKIFTEEGRYPSDIRRAALERVCLTMLRLVSVAALKEFFMDHIKAIMATVEAKQTKASETALENQVVSKLCALELLEVMYSRLSKDDVNSRNSQVNSKYCNGSATSGKEMTMTITKAANAIKSEDMRGESQCLEQRRQLHCAAYNTLIAVISSTQTELKFYQGFLFTENPAKGQFLLDNLIDENRKYEFDIVMEAALERRKKFVSIRNEVREVGLEDAEEEDYKTTSVHYLASQYLADSSLSADVSQFDFGSSMQTSVISTMSGSYERDRRQQARKRKAAQGAEQESPGTLIKEDYVEMEMDVLNQHECMATMSALLQHMHRNEITPPVERGSSPTEMPSWMAYLHRKLTGSSTETNVKLFIAKLILNAEEVFRPYAKFWIAPIVHLIVMGETGSAGIHYLVVDLVVTILSWHTVAIPEDSSTDRAMASRLVEFMMQNCHHEQRNVFKNNLEVLKTLVEVWRSRIEAPTKVLYDNFSKHGDKSRESISGIQMVGVLLANKVNPFRPGCGVDKERFYQHLAMNMNNTLKTMHAPAAEVVGMALKFMDERERSEVDCKWRDTYLENIRKMLMGLQQAQPQIFVTCISKIVKHFLPAADKFLSKALFMLPRLHAEFRTQCLEVIQMRIDEVENAFLELKNKDILGILTHRDEATQLVALKLVHGMLVQLKADELAYLIPAVAAFTTNPSATCRAQMYDIFIWIYDNYREDESESSASILTATKDCLLQGLSDEDLKNRLTIQNFWSHESRLPTETVDRLVAMLEAMYSPTTEAQYLAYATNLLLEMTSKSADYNREIFEHPLSECRFEDYKVASGWRQRHVAMTPLFAETQSSQAGSPTSESWTGEVMSTGNVRATQDAQQFTPTQEQGGSKGPYNWLTQSSLDTYSDFNLTVPATGETQSTLLFTVGKSSSRQNTKRFKKQGPGFGRDRLAADTGRDQTDSSQDVTESQEILRLKRRFLKDHEASRVYFIKRAARQNKLKEDIRRDQKLRRENQVTLYRKYRIGDLPDIQIKYSYIIAPLQALAQKDNTIARLLFSSVFKAIFAEIDHVKTDREARETVEKIKQCMNDMLANSTHYSPAFIGCMLDIALEYPRKIELDQAAVNTACLTSLQQPLGILLLEETILQQEGEDARPTKKARGAAPVSLETSSWIEVARLHKSLGAYDVLQGIFSNKFGTRELTKEAMEAEMRGDFQTAAKLYSEGLSRPEAEWEGEPPDEVEMDLWDDSRLQCYNNLTQWSRLEQFTTQAIDDRDPPQLDKVWDDTYYQEHYLPFLLRGKLKLMLEGDESQQSLLHLVDNAMKIPERKALLESRYSEELALMYLWQEDYDRARHYTNQAVQVFLQEWSSMSGLMASSRSATLQGLQKLTELQEFLEFMAKEDNFSSVDPATALVSRWVKRSPDPIMDRADIWDDVITNRCVFVDLVSSQLEKGGATMQVDGCNDFEESKVVLRLAQADSAMCQDNFPVALKQLKATNKIVKQLGNGRLQLQWTQTYARTHNRKCQVMNQDSTERLSALAGSLEQLEKHSGNKVLSVDYQLSRQHHLLKGETVHQMACCLQGDSISLSDLSDDVRNKVKAAGNCNKHNLPELLASLAERGYQDVKAAAGVAGSELDAGLNTDMQGINAAYLALVKYCDHYLRLKEEAEDGSTAVDCPSMDTFATAVTTALLTAMKNDSVEARQLFPRLLQLVEYYPETVDVFIKKSAVVPCWMFISWISQMTALLDKQESPAIQNLLLDVGKTYPEALIYPFKMSCEGYEFENSAAGKKSKQISDRLSEMLSRNKMVNAFISALEQFGQPNALFKDWFDDMLKLMATKVQSRDKKKIQGEYRTMYSDLMDYSGESEEDLYDTQETAATIPEHIGMGVYRRKFGKEYAKKLDKLFGKDGSKLQDMSYKEFATKAQELRLQMDEDVRSGRMAPPGTMKEYSKFLADFQAANYDQELEIPGQYTGVTKPMPEYHTKVSSFDERVKVMQSIRKPKRITLRGNDEKEYMFLAKGGEDLRQDQRIEQLFEIMNKVFANDAACRQRKLHLRTYQVIPMTPRVGLIEWMKQTIPLKEFLYNALNEGERKFISSTKGPASDHGKWVGGSGKENYMAAYKKYSRSDTVNAFKKQENMVPWDLLRRAYKSLSASAEAYFTLRNNMATSHAVVSISQYILGIGDRHLSNFMVDLETGKMVGIDFGHAFGSATQFLPIPELMPFRLTRQLRMLMKPLREKGLLEGTMVHTLRALRNNSDLLLATMDVFIKEPSLDWQVFAEKQRKEMTKAGLDVEDAEIDTQWYPKQKVSYARKKLEGYNPAIITKSELTLGHLKSVAYKDIVRVLMGDKAFDIRAKLPGQGLSVEQQVACLLNQCTDPNILGRVWRGWEPWM